MAQSSTLKRVGPIELCHILSWYSHKLQCVLSGFFYRPTEISELLLTGRKGIHGGMHLHSALYLADAHFLYDSTTFAHLEPEGQSWLQCWSHLTTLSQNMAENAGHTFLNFTCGKFDT
ncbi:hypothetical protein ILYODFUR_016631 [Ilyodon furcidens]|uniref:Uncharacterized protein n=1 Tax=Ilyodon furcidens TaxID=33524 RepID=A0ABV0TAB8_9TELE